MSASRTLGGTDGSSPGEISILLLAVTFDFKAGEYRDESWVAFGDVGDATNCTLILSLLQLLRHNNVHIRLKDLEIKSFVDAKETATEYQILIEVHHIIQ
ncbi:hypothetical protein E2C01_015495 [Portunus trituberculatus]|uniref:Uncharacterized protein n=1 Tax=Portunus trituberculatus TaxID=210409 RepID=A0A5B7DN26_PORTR|nr:hypothetical protein [Portunus trituberculatus]